MRYLSVVIGLFISGCLGTEEIAKQLGSESICSQAPHGTGLDRTVVSVYWNDGFQKVRGTDTDKKFRIKLASGYVSCTFPSDSSFKGDRMTLLCGNEESFLIDVELDIDVYLGMRMLSPTDEGCDCIEKSWRIYYWAVHQDGKRDQFDITVMNDYCGRT